MLLIQIVLVAFFIMAIARVVIRYRQGGLKWQSLFFWSVLWIVAGIAVLAPNSTMYLARLLGVGRGVDVVTYLAIALLFYLFFRVTVEIEQVNRNIVKIVQRQALKDIEEKK